MDSVEQQEQRRQDAGAKMRHAAGDRLAYKQARGLAPAGKAAPGPTDRKAGHGSVGEKRGAGRSKQGGLREFIAEEASDFKAGGPPDRRPSVEKVREE